MLQLTVSESSSSSAKGLGALAEEPRKEVEEVVLGSDKNLPLLFLLESIEEGADQLVEKSSSSLPPDEMTASRGRDISAASRSGAPMQRVSPAMCPFVLEKPSPGSPRARKARSDGEERGARERKPGERNLVRERGHTSLVQQQTITLKSN